MIRTTFPQIRLYFRPQPARLRPSRIVRCGFGFLTSKSNTRTAPAVRGKVFPMSIDFEKYRAAAKAAGDETIYSDANVLRLWAAIDYLVARSIHPQKPREPIHGSNSAARQNTLHSSQTQNGKEATP